MDQKEMYIEILKAVHNEYIDQIARLVVIAGRNLDKEDGKENLKVIHLMAACETIAKMLSDHMTERIAEIENISED